MCILCVRRGRDRKARHWQRRYGTDLRLGEVGLERAKMWRRVFGARLGCYSKRRAGKVLAGQKKKGTFINVKRGVLKAAGQAVSARAPRRGATTIFDTSTSSVACPEDSKAGTCEDPYWNKEFAKFDKTTRQKQNPTSTNSALLRRFPKWRKIGARPILAPPTLQSRHVVLVGDCGDELTIGRHTKVLPGVRQYALADLIVMENIADLWSASEDSGLLILLVHVICLGKPVASASALHLADMNPAQILPRNIAFHRAAISQKVLSLRYTAFFHDAHPAVLRALKACAAQENSK